MSHNNREYYQNILASIPDGLAVISKTLTIQTLNNAMEELTGCSAHTMQDQPVTRLFPEKSDVPRVIKKILSDGGTHAIHDYIHFNVQNKNSFPASVVASPLLDEHGNPDAVIIVMRNMRRMRELEEGLKRAEKLSLAATLAVGMAHEIKNPLAGISGAAQLLMEEVGETACKEYVRIIKKEADRVNAIVEQLLDLTRVGSMKTGAVNIHKVLDDILRLLEKNFIEQKTEVVRKYDPSLPPVRADRDRITQVFLNLIKNGVESIEEGGVLTLTTKISYDYPLIREKKEKTMMGLIEVADTGGGVSREAGEKIFTPFFSTKTKGTGLGLAISHKIIEEHGGKITIGNRTDGIQGGVAAVLLPLKGQTTDDR